MPQGLQVWNAAGTLIFDSETAIGGTVAAFVTLTGSTQVKSYPEFAGRTATIAFQYGWVNTMPTISYSSGYPVITFPPNVPGSSASFMVVMY